MGIESWHQVLFGRPGRDYETAFLLACIAAAYDNAVDEEHFRDWPHVTKDRSTAIWLSPKGLRVAQSDFDRFAHPGMRLFCHIQQINW